MISHVDYPFTSTYVLFSCKNMLLVYLAEGPSLLGRIPRPLLCNCITSCSNTSVPITHDFYSYTPFSRILESTYLPMI